MLRDFIHHPNDAQLRSVLGRFAIRLDKDPLKLSLISFLVLSPDSFLWKLRINGAIYYLYAEDYVANLEDIRTTIAQRANNNATLKFIPTVETKKFKNTSAHKAASVYSTLDPERVMKFAADSGHDLVFLCKSDEDSNEAFFN